MRPNPQFPAYLVTFTEEILDGKLHFLCSEMQFVHFRNCVPLYLVFDSNFFQLGSIF